VALAVLVMGLVLLAIGVSAGAWIAIAGIVGAVLVNLLAPWPGRMGWRAW
jgi:hypothetical protein